MQTSSDPGPSLEDPFPAEIPRLSILCIFNDRKSLDTLLVPSLEKQSVPFQLLLLDNTEERYPSAVKAFNNVLPTTKRDYLVFIHQDFSFDSPTFLEDCLKLIDQIPDLGIAGIAGKKKGYIQPITNITHGERPQPAGIRFIGSPLDVQTVDECFFIIKRDVAIEIPFDETTCDSWHFYAVDYSLGLAEKDKRVVILPLEGYHKSSGNSMSRDYFNVLQKMKKKYKNQYTCIHTTVGTWYLFLPVEVNRMKYIVLSWLACSSLLTKIYRFFLKKTGKNLLIDNRTM